MRAVLPPNHPHPHAVAPGTLYKHATHVEVWEDRVVDSKAAAQGQGHCCGQWPATAAGLAECVQHLRTLPPPDPKSIINFEQDRTWLWTIVWHVARAKGLDCPRITPQPTEPNKHP